MKFRIEAHVGIEQERYRLQKNGKWKLIGSLLTKNSNGFNRDDFASPEDRLFDTLEDAGYFSTVMPNELTLGGKKRAVNIQGGTLAEISDSVKIKPMIYRITKPHLFTKDEVCYAIQSGDDSRNNTLIVDLEGHVKIVEFSTKNLSEFSPIAVRNETFCAGNSYAGYEAAKDKSHVAEQYESLIEGWIVHLMTNQLGVHSDNSEGKSEQELIKEIDYLTEHLK